MCACRFLTDAYLNILDRDDDSNIGGYNSVMTDFLQPNTIYYVMAGFYAGRRGSFELDIEILCKGTLHAELKHHICEQSVNRASIKVNRRGLSASVAYNSVNQR